MSKSLQERLNSLERKYRSLCCKANSETPSAPAYRVFTALLTQRGGIDFQSITSGPLIIGATYQILVEGANDDFTNVGAPNNNFNTYFVATGTTPNHFDGSILDYNAGAPVVTVLENTIGNIWFEYAGIGSYLVKSDNLFLDRKTTVSLSPNSYIESPADIHSIDVLWRDGVEDRIEILCYYNYQLADEQLNYGGNAFIEIRVYN